MEGASAADGAQKMSDGGMREGRSGFWQPQEVSAALEK
jgi:hypothetical protein